MNIGDKFHRLTVLGLIHDSKNPKALCVCDCGKVVTPQCGALKNGRAKSCGCLRVELLAAHSASLIGTGMSKEEKRAKTNLATINWQINNRDKYRKKMRAWYSKNKEKLSEKRKEKAIEKSKYDAKYRVLNRERIAIRRRVNDHKRRIREVSSFGSVSKDIAARLIKFQKGKCAVCKKCIRKNYEIDHINPLARGGQHDDKNLQLLCGFCNRSKGAKDPIEYMQKKGFLL